MSPDEMDRMYDEFGAWWDGCRKRGAPLDRDSALAGWLMAWQRARDIYGRTLADAAGRGEGGG